MRFLNCDAMEGLLELEDKSVDAIITDPPYDFGKDEMRSYMDQFKRVCNGHILIFCPPENQWDAPRYLFWVKPTSTKNFSKNHGRFVEMIAWISGGDTFNPLFWANMTGVYQDVIEGPRLHEFQKPMSLMSRLVLIHSNPGELILDPFAGSGTTLLAAKREGRNFIGFEIDKETHEAATHRVASG